MQVLTTLQAAGGGASGRDVIPFAFRLPDDAPPSFRNAKLLKDAKGRTLRCAAAVAALSLAAKGRMSTICITRALQLCAHTNGTRAAWQSCTSSRPVYGPASTLTWRPRLRQPRTAPQKTSTSGRCACTPRQRRLRRYAASTTCRHRRACWCQSGRGRGSRSM